ncbi:RagB/SusD family nutrient uptake outer membrane protein [Gaetbulibacter sp. M240]|uniref:RagB/SusD family nutrient uptake outer membrane protein n=1 Tax=Gaetbulibacter sp. M240 TaxID=3126511 RepID=UPI00374F4F04
MLRNNNLNKVKVFVTMCLVIFIANSCDDLVDEVPESEISPENFFRNNEDLETALTAAYDGLQNAYATNTFYWGEIRSENHQSIGAQANGDDLDIINNNITPGNPQTRWDRLYLMIERANQVIFNAPKISGYNKNFLGEAYAIRAKGYFDAIRVWGDVPLFTEPVTLLSEAMKPATDATTIMNDVVIADMLKAEELLTIPSSNFRFSRASVYALQAEVYMWLNDYAKAKQAIEALINLGEHSLVTTPEAWDDLFYNNLASQNFPEGRGKIQTGPELIMSIQYNLEEQVRFGGSHPLNRSGVQAVYFSPIPSYAISEVVENKWRDKFPIDSLGWVTKYPGTDPALTRTVTVDDGMGGVIEVEQPVYGDWRYYYSREGRVDNFSSVEIGSARTAKWNQTPQRSDLDDTDIVLYRYADMILLLAEAENQLGNDIRALELVNQVRTARQLPLVDPIEFGASPDERLNFILDERQFELFGEGKRWWDLVRNNKASEVLDPVLAGRENALPLTPGRELWPIFVEHLIENPLLNQNEAYNN